MAWHNPALHERGRRKVWLACAEHLGELRDFLERGRGFDVRIEPLAAVHHPPQGMP